MKALVLQMRGNGDSSREGHIFRAGPGWLDDGLWAQGIFGKNASGNYTHVLYERIR